MASSPETDWLAHFSSVRNWYFGMTVVLVVLGITLKQLVKVFQVDFHRIVGICSPLLERCCVYRHIGETEPRQYESIRSSNSTTAVCRYVIPYGTV